VFGDRIHEHQPDEWQHELETLAAGNEGRHPAAVPGRSTRRAGGSLDVSDLREPTRTRCALVRRLSAGDRGRPVMRLAELALVVLVAVALVRAVQPR
jgi:hypothetical protein